jgi:putative MATE family efflux protein
MNKTNELGTESVGKLLLKFSIPSIVGMLVNVLYSIVDRAFVGQGVGELQLSGVAVTFPITNIIMAFAMLAGVGASAVVSIKLGQHKKESAEKVLGNAFVLLVLFSIVITILGLLILEPLLKLLGASPETMPYAKQFGAIILSGMILQSVSMGLNSVIRSEGNPRIAMFTMLIGAILNLIANPILIFGFKMGVVGSGLATIFSQIVTTAWTLRYFTKGKSLLKLKRENFKLEKEVVKEILAIGMSPFAMQLAASLVTVSFNITLKKYGGDIAIGAMASVNSIAMLILMPVIGINQGVQPIIGYNYGAKKYDRVKSALKYAMIGATAITTAGFVIVELFPGQIMRIFSEKGTDLAEIGSRGLQIFLLMLPIVGVAIVGSNYFQAIAKAKLSMLLSLLRQVIFLIPLILILPTHFQLEGVWMSQPIADVLTTTVTGYFIIREIKRISKLSNQADPDENYQLDA